MFGSELRCVGAFNLDLFRFSISMSRRVEQLSVGASVLAMKNPSLHSGLSGAFLALVFAALPCAAQVYKWVDANGRTHYAASKEEAGQAKAAEVKIKAGGPSEEEAKASAQSWQIRNRGVDQRLAEKPIAVVAPPPQVARAPRSLSGGIDDGSAESKCNFARDILSGGLKRRDGLPLSAGDRNIAQNDIKVFCPK